MKRRWFGTDGVRGVFGKEPMTGSFAYRLGWAVATFFREQNQTVKLAIGRDTRSSGPILEEAFCDGVEKAGGCVTRLGVLPTAAVAWFTKEKGFTAGAVISASHNPAEENGIKLFQGSGEKLSDEQESLIEQGMEACTASWDERQFATRKKNTAESWLPSVEGMQVYEACLRRHLPKDFSLAGVRIFVDGANGSAWHTTPTILKNFGAEVKAFHAHPTGENINDHCGSTHAEVALAEGRNLPGWIGIIHDGDADRIYMVDEKGVLLDGDDLMAILALDWLERGVLKDRTLVATSMSNCGLEEVLSPLGGRILRTDVGDRYVLKGIKDGNFNLGGEQSGHLMLPEFAPAGDGLLVGLHVLEVSRRKGIPLAELRRPFFKYPQSLQSLKVLEKRPLSEMPKVAEAVARAEKNLAQQGRVVLRYSGTENKIRLLVEARDANKISEIEKDILSSLEAILVRNG